MKTPRRLFTTLFLLCLAGMATAQDVIVRTDNSTVLSKVLEISSTEIKYKKWDNLEEPTYSIGKSEVLSINYKNGEVEIFSDAKTDQTSSYQQQFKGAMKPSGLLGERLSINGYNLSDEQVQRLVDEQSYQLYLKAKKQFNTTMILSSVGFVSLIVGGSIIAGTSVKNPNYDQLSTIGGVGITIGVCTLLPATFIGMYLDHKTNKIALEYNKKHGYYHALNVSPSMMRCEIPQSQGNYGLGLTLSMDF